MVRLVNSGLAGNSLVNEPPLGGGGDAYSGLLDESYADNAIVAFSIRRMRAGYTGDCMNIRRDSDDTNQDIGFDANGLLDYAAIETFCGTGAGYVETWYNQGSGGSTYDVTNSVHSEQPTICFFGSAMPAPQWDDTSVSLTVDVAPVTSAGFSLHAWAAVDDTTDVDQGLIWIGDKDVSTDEWALGFDTGSDQVGMFANDASVAVANSTTGVIAFRIHHYGGVEATASSRSAYRDGANKGTDTTTVTPDGADRLTIGAYGRATPTAHFEGMIWELVIFSDVKTDADMVSLHAFGHPNSKSNLMGDQDYADQCVCALSFRKEINLFGGPLINIYNGTSSRRVYESPLTMAVDMDALANFGANVTINSWFDQSTSRIDVHALTSRPSLVIGGVVQSSLVFDDTASQHMISTAGAPVTASPYTIHASFVSNDDTINGCIASVADTSSSAESITLMARGADAGNPCEHGVKSASATDIGVETSTAFTQDAAHTATAVSSSSSNHSAFIDAGSKVTDSSTIAPSGIDRLGVGVHARSSLSQNFSGKIGSVFVFSEAKSDADVTSLHTNTAGA